MGNEDIHKKTAVEIENAFRKLQSSLYFEKQNLQLRHKMVEFCSKGIKNQLDELEGHLLNPAYNFPCFRICNSEGVNMGICNAGTNNCGCRHATSLQGGM